MTVVALPVVVTVELSGPVQSGVAAVGVRVNVVPAAILSGAQSVCLGVGEASVWSARVAVGGADVSEQIVGDIVVEAEESAARIAEFTLRPPSGTTVSLAAWTGLPVTIDVVDMSTGAPLSPMRLFTGIVDLPGLALSERTLSLRCTDDLQGRCDGMSNAELKALIGGYESPAVFDAAASGWDYAQDRLETVAASLDISPEGQLRVTSWTPKATPHRTFGASLIGDGSLAVSVAPRAELLNQVDIAFDYRFPRIKAECYPVSYSYVNMTNFAAFILAGGWWLQRAQVESAIAAAGGTVESITYTPLPTSITPVGSGYFTPSAADAGLCMGFDASVSFDYAQTIEEHHRITVRNALSIAAVGLRRESLSGALEGVYADLTAAETNIRTFRQEQTGIPPADYATAVAGKTASVDATLSAETNRAAANAAMEALIAVAKVRIRASHRRNRVSATVPLIPSIDVDKTLRIDADGVQATGKCASVVHRLSPETGLATSEFALALCSLAGVGVTHDDAAIAADSGTAAGQTDLAGSPVVVFNSGASQDHVLTITFPGVEAAERALAEPIITSTIAAGLVEDEFSITV